MKQRIARVITRHRFGMLSAVDLDDEARFDADEVGDVVPKRVLAAEFMT